MKWNSIAGSAARCVLICLMAGAVGLSVVAPAPRAAAQQEEAFDAEAALKQVRDDLRSAQSLMFRGKAEESDAILKKIEPVLAKLQKADPENGSIKIVANNYARLRRDVDRRLPKKPEPPKDAPQAPDTPASADDSAALVKQVKDGLRAADRSLFQRDAEAARKQLKAVAPSLQKLAKADPDNADVKRALTQYETIKRKVDIQLGPDPESGEAPPLKSFVRGAVSRVGRALDDIEQLLAKAPASKESPEVEDFIKDLKSELLMLRKDLGDPGDEGTSSLHSMLKQYKTPADHPEVAAVLKRHDAVMGKAATIEIRLTGVASATVDRKAIDREVEALKQAALAADAQIGQTLTFFTPNATEPQKLQERLAAIEKLEAEHVAKLTPLIQAFEAKYGDDSQAILQKLGAMGYLQSTTAESAWIQANKQVDRVAQERKDVGDALHEQIKRAIEQSEKVHDFFFDAQVGTLPRTTALALRFDPSNEELAEIDGSIEATVAKLREAYNARIDAREWPKHATGVKDVSKMADTALKFFAAHPEWGRSSKADVTCEAVAVTADWRVTKTNLVGQPVQWGLPILIAVKHSGDGEKNVLRVYELTAVNAEKAGQKPEPPFFGYFVGDSYYIRPAAVKGR